MADYLKEFIEGEIIYASEQNSNNNYLLDQINDSAATLNNKINTVNSSLSSQIATTLQTIYPIGAIYIGTTEECPIASLFGTWELVSEGIVSDIEDTIPVQGDGKSLGLKGDTDTYGLATSSSGDIGRLLGVNTSARGISAGTSISRQTSPRNFFAVGVTTDSTKSGLVGTANTTKLEVNIWKRTA